MRRIINLAFLLLLTSFCNGQIKFLSSDRIEASEEFTKSRLEAAIPEYPAELRGKGISGRVVTKLVIGKQGFVASASAVEGDATLMESALKAVKQWKFRPYIVNSHPVEVETTATIVFSTQEPYVRASRPITGPFRLRVSQGVAESRIMRKVQPLYPGEAKAQRIQGDVILGFTIDRTGHVANLHPLEGDTLLAEAAMDTVKQWIYKPYKLNGEPVEVETTAKISFRM